MALEITAALVLGTIGVVGGIVSYDQQKKAAKSAEKNAELQLAQANYNRKVQEQETAALVAEGQENARRQREAAEYARSQRIAALGKSGAAMSSGSPLAILGAAAADEEQNIMDAHYLSARQVAASKGKEANYSWQADIARHNVAAAKNSAPDGWSLALGMTGGALSSLSSYNTAIKAGTAVTSAASSAWGNVSNMFSSAPSGAAAGAGAAKASKFI